MYKENQGGDRFKGGLIIWHRREVVAPQPSVPAHKSSKHCKNANIFRKIKSKCKITQLHVMSMSLSSVWGVCECVCVYIQKSEAAIRGFLPKNTDVEKTERAQENLWFNTDETIYPFDSRSLSSFTSRWRQSSEGQTCAASNKCDIFGRGKTKKVWRYKDPSDSWTANDWSGRLGLSRPPLRLTDVSKQQDLSSSSPSLSCVFLEKTGRQTSTSLQPCTHQTPERRGSRLSERRTHSASAENV